MLYDDDCKKLLVHLWGHVDEAARAGNSEREAAFLRAILLIEMASGKIKAK